MAFLYATGVRRNELLKAEYKHITFKNNSIIIIGKGNTFRKIYFSDDAKILLKLWIKERGASQGYLFGPVVKGKPVLEYPLSPSSLRNILYKRARAAKLGKLTTHDFRRSFCTQLLRISDPFTVCKLAGHKKVDTTLKYDLCPEESKMNAAMKLSFLA